MVVFALKVRLLATSFQLHSFDISDILFLSQFRRSGRYMQLKLHFLNLMYLYEKVCEVREVTNGLNKVQTSQLCTNITQKVMQQLSLSYPALFIRAQHDSRDGGTKITKITKNL